MKRFRTDIDEVESDGPVRRSHTGGNSHSTEVNVKRDQARGGSLSNRRQFLTTAGSLAVIGLLSGCSGDNGNSSSDGENGSSNIEEWLSETDNYDGNIETLNENSVTVKAGPESNEMVFAPAAIRITPGTTVTWKWIGSGTHNVVAKGGQFNSGAPETGATFEHTFETTGTILYYCKPHRTLGMKGAIVVEEANSQNSANLSNDL